METGILAGCPFVLNRGKESKKGDRIRKKVQFEPPGYHRKKNDQKGVQKTDIKNSYKRKREGEKERNFVPVYQDNIV